MVAKTYSTQDGKAYYYNNINDFLFEDSTVIIGKLINKAFKQYSTLDLDQNNAWNYQIESLQRKLKEHGVSGDIIFEYDIVRLGKRIDVILLIKHMVFSLEFKNNKKIFEAQDAQQAEDYAIDIKNFHKESEDLYVCPILIATHANAYSKNVIDAYDNKQIRLQKENIDTLIPKVMQISDKYGDAQKLDFNRWFNSPYYPTPTIISAAIEVYNTHSLSDIAKSEAGQKNIDGCEEIINKVIEYAKENSKKCVCFVTGVPGAGKTLVGLDIVAKNLAKGEERLSVYLSGNGALIEVLREALNRSYKKTHPKATREEKKKSEAGVNALIQSGFAFKMDNAFKKEETPEHILIFDEAQRVWSQQKMVSKHKDKEMKVSEPYLLYKIMDKRTDWAVMICLVGLGQDIYDGEVGINEWFRCGIEDFKNWELYYSTEIFNQVEDKRIDINAIKECERCHAANGLHLSTSIRSFRSDKQSQFVNALLNNDPKNASKYYKLIIDKYPLYVTRDYSKAKQWAKSQVRGTQRCGVLACSSAQRLKPEGIYVTKDIDVKNWFLAPNDDLRSSNMMEIVASEFKVQGLEIDWAVVCWDQDLRRDSKSDLWDYFNFRGTSWCKINRIEKQSYLVNSYRVLLTRARQGQVIYVPFGVDKELDKTRDSSEYQKIYDYLKLCGITDL